MKDYIFWSVLVLIIAGGGYLITNNGIPVTHKENVMSNVIIKEGNLKGAARSLDANSQPKSSLSSQMVFPQQANEEAQTYDLNDSFEGEQLAASLRTEGVPEEDIQHILKRSTTEPSPTAIEGAEAQTYDLNDSFEREQLAASLRTEGIMEGEVQKIVRNSLENEAPQDQSESPLR